VSRLVVLIGCVAALLFAVEPAHACICAPIQAQERLARADAAFIGVLTNRRMGPAPPPVGTVQPGGDEIFSFRVDHAVKGRLGRRIEVMTPSTSSCRLEIGIGERIGLLLFREDGRWRSMLCMQVSPANLREAERQLPRPNGKGPVRFLVGGTFGSARLVALDARGRTLGYGAGTGRTKLLAVCPRGRRAVEVVDGAPERVAVRDMRTMSVIRETALPTSNFAAKTYCRDADAQDVYVFVKRQPGNPPGGPSAILQLTVGGIHERYVGSADSAVFRGNVVHLNDGPGGRTLVQMDLRSGDRRELVTAPFRMAQLAISARGTIVAGVDHDRGSLEPPRLVLVKLDGSPQVRSTALDRSSRLELAWLDDTRLAVFGGRRGSVFDSRLRVLGTLRRWWALSFALSSETAYGVVPPLTPFGGQGWLHVARLPNGPARRARGFPGQPTVIATVPGRVTLRTQRRAFCLPGV
jgi:hypothetical protein